MKNVILSICCLILLSSCGDTYEIAEDGILVPLTVIEDPSIPSIDINGVKLHSEAFGNPSDPMIIAIHGGPGADYRSLLNFKQLVEDGFYLVFYDQRGSGLSERLDKEAYSSVQVYIDELDGVVNHYRQAPDQKIILAGHSWGAMLATAYINQNPNQIDGVVLAEPGGFTWDQTFEYLSKTQQIKLGDESTNDFVYQDQFITGSDHNTLDYKLALSLAGTPTTGDALIPSFWRYGAICNSASIQLAIDNPEQMDFTENLMSHEQKVLFVYSELNEAYGRTHAELLASELLNVELLEIKNCGHEIPEFGWSNFYPVIKTYLVEIL